MVWFQCDDCGDNVKKPKLAFHFRSCRASSLSCIDCGAVFDQKSVQQHTLCVSEAQKYGPKDLVQPQAPQATGKVRPSADDVLELKVGLSTRPPWLCSLCNVKTNSEPTLASHAQGKKHRSKAKAHLASLNGNNGDTKKESVSVEDQINDVDCQNKEQDQKHGLTDATGVDRNERDQTDGLTDVGLGHNSKRKNRGLDASSQDHRKVKLENGLDDSILEVKENVESNCLPSGHSTKKIKLKRLICKALKQAPDGTLQQKKLQKQVLAMAMEKFNSSEDTLALIFKQHLESSTRFQTTGKYVKLLENVKN